MTNYAQISDVRKRGLPEPSPTDDEINVALNIADELVNAWCGQDFIQHDDNEIIVDGNDGDRIVLGMKIIEITELKINDVPVPIENVVSCAENWIGEIALKNGYKFSRGSSNVAITADTGWEEIPSAITEASAHLAAMVLNKQLFSGRPEIPEMDSERLLDYSRKRVKPSDVQGIIDADPYLAGLLRPYRLRGVKC